MIHDDDDDLVWEDTLKTVGIKATISECTLTLVISVLVILQHTLFWRNRPPHLG